MKVGEGPRSSRPVVSAKPARSHPAAKGKRPTVSPDTYEVAPRPRWSPPGFHGHLPPEDLEAARQCPPPPVPSNPALARFLEQHPEIKTNQDFISHWYDQGGWGALVKGCEEVGIAPADVTNYRSAAIRDLAYPPPPPDGSLPMTAAEADRFHIVQYANPTYNPTGPDASKNCGPASLAMVLDSQGKMPPGLTPEQKVDYARALMFPDDAAIEHIEVGGAQIPQLNEDAATTGKEDIERGAEQAGLQADVRSDWYQLDEALRAGNPIVAFGDCYEAWKLEFPDRGLYGGGEIPHFIAILGKTADGNYIVSDPMYRGGPVEMTRDDLAVYFNKDDDNTPRFVAIESTGETPATPAEDVPVRMRQGEYWVE